MTKTIDLCQAILRVADDQGDNSVTFHCQLAVGHPDMHKETNLRDDKHLVTVTWQGDSRKDASRDATYEMLADVMDDPPTLKEMSKWTDEQLKQAGDWALWKDSEDLIEIYPKPDWLE